ncbi:MAG: hypothetical protein ABW007_15560 [Chitinophagaceae bacterium]
MLKKHRNALLTIFREANLNPELFTLETSTFDGSEEVKSFLMKVRETNLYFHAWTVFSSDSRSFDCDNSEFKIVDSVAIYKEPLRGGLGAWFSDFDRVERNFKRWLDTDVQKYLAYKAEQEEEQKLPDLWAELKWALGANEQTQIWQNGSFSSEEHAYISNTLNKFLGEVKELRLVSSEQLENLTKEVAHLIEESKHLSRKDWMAAAASAIIGFMLQASFTTENAIHFLQLAGRALRWIMTSPILLQ